MWPRRRWTSLSFSKLPTASVMLSRRTPSVSAIRDCVMVNSFDGTRSRNDKIQRQSCRSTEWCRGGTQYDHFAPEAETTQKRFNADNAFSAGDCKCGGLPVREQVYARNGARGQKEQAAFVFARVVHPAKWQGHRL
jgi:hypothetical protein